MHRSADGGRQQQQQQQQHLSSSMGPSVEGENGGGGSRRVRVAVVDSSVLRPAATGASASGRGGPRSPSSLPLPAASPPLVRVDYADGDTQGQQAQEEDVLITHVSPDAARRDAEVEAGILRRVDGLAAYFGGLLEEDGAKIEELERRLAAAHHQQEQHGQQQHGQQQEQHQQQQQQQRSDGQQRKQLDALAGYGGYFVRRGTVVCVALALLALLIVIIGLAAGLGAQRSAARAASAAAAAAASMRPPTPEFLFAPTALPSVSRASALDIRLAVSRAASVSYVVVPRGGGQGGSGGGGGAKSSGILDGAATGRAIVAASAGLLGGSPLERAAVACGRLPIPRAGVNATLSVAGRGAMPECSGQSLAAGATNASSTSCARCPSLVAGAAYTVWLVPSGGDDAAAAAVGAPARLDVTAGILWALGSAPAAGAPSSNETGVIAARAAPAGDHAFNLTFSLAAPGSLHFVVLYASVAARFVDAYVAFDNRAPGDAATLLAGDLDAFAGGAVARGTCVVPRAGVMTTCRFGPAPRATSGPDADPGAYSCSTAAPANGADAGAAAPAVSCAVQNACFGALCDYSRYGLAPNATYKVVLVAQQQQQQQQQQRGTGPATDGGDSVFGLPHNAGSFRTSPTLSAPQVLPSLQVDNSSISGDRVRVVGVGQDKPGFVYVAVSRQSSSRQLAGIIGPGSATTFAPATAASARRLRRQLLQDASSTSSLAVMPPDAAAAGSAGAAFLPQCPVHRDCDVADAIESFVPGGAPAVVHSECIPVARITEQAGVVATGLDDDTVYRVVVVTTDLAGHQAAWQALARTQDLTPPVLTVVASPPPLFTSFEVAVTLNEPGVVFAMLLPPEAAAAAALAAANTNGTSSNSTGATRATCPPEQAAAGSPEPIATVSAPAPEAGARVNFTFSRGVEPNADYLVRLIARDAAGNCQRRLTDVVVHTADNAAPTTVAARVTGVTGTTASLEVALDEPGRAFFVVVPANVDADGNGGVDGCPSVAAVFTAGGATRNGTSAGGGGGAAGVFAATGVVTVEARAPAEARAALRGLSSETAYVACVAAEDATQLRNRQTAVRQVAFRTLDVTPPTVAIRVARSADGDDATCERAAPYSCNATWSASFSEPGYARWALVRSDALSAQLPTPAQVLGAANFSAALAADAAAAAIVAEGQLAAPPADSAPVAVRSLRSGVNYTLLLAPRDEAQPAPNTPPALVSVVLAVRDVQPPAFLSLDPLAEDLALNVTLSLDEAATTFCVVTAAGPLAGSAPLAAHAPTVAEVLGGTAADGAAPVATGSVTTAAANASAVLSVGGLARGRRYDLHFAAVDAAGNRQLAVTTVRGVRTTDSVPPVISDFTATWTPPMRLVLSLNASKPGALRFLARRAPQQPAPATAQSLLDDVAAGSVASANFTGSAALPAAAAGGATVVTLCVADGDGLVVHAVAQDLEGDAPGRWPNNSTLSSAVVARAPSPAAAACEPAQFLAPLRPSLEFGLAGAGLPLGVPNATVDPGTGITTWTQAAGAFMREPSLARATLRAVAGLVQLGGAGEIVVQPPQPTAVSLLVCSETLVPEAVSTVGRTLRVSFQLTDGSGRTAVDTAGLVIRPVLTIPPLPSTAGGGASNRTRVELTGCSARGVDAASGIGECAALVDAAVFPVAGSVVANVTLLLTVGSAVIASSQPATVQLQAAPPLTPFTPSVPGVLATLPARALHAGEPFEVELTAANPLARGVTGWTLRLRYDALLLDLVGVASAQDLWLPAETTATTAGGGGGGGSVREVTVSVADRSADGRRSESAFRSSGAIPLATVSFVPRAALPGAHAGAVGISAAATMLYPSWPAPPVAFHDHRGGLQSTGSIRLATPRAIGMFAWAERGHVFNTARFTGERLTARLRAAVVRTWGAPMATPVSPTTCAASSSASAAMGASMTIDALGCAAIVDASNSAPAKDVGFTLGAGGFFATAVLSVWQPTRLAVEAEDATLNSVLPMNAAAPPPGCAADRYQSTRLRARADWTNGGAAAGDVVAATDVTPLASFASNDSSVVAVVGGVARGVSPGAASVGLNDFAPAGARLPTAAAAVVTVTNVPACLLSLEPLATTGVVLVNSTVGSSSSSSSSSGGGAASSAPSTTTTSVSSDDTALLLWRASQSLVWEEARARVVTVASFSDGAAMDVSDRASLELSAGGSSGGSVGAASIFRLVTDPAGAPFAVVNATVSGAAPVTSCSAALTASWDVCSLRLGDGRGPLVLALPKPLAIASLTAQPAAIAPTGDPATLQPFSMPTEALLSVAVSFSDGSSRDFSADPRVTFSVLAGAALCSVERLGDGSSSGGGGGRGGGGGAWRVTTAATGSTTPAEDSCTLEARVSFRDAPPLTATVAVGVVALRALPLYALPATQLTPPVLPPRQPAVAGTLRLLRCDARNYDQRSLWAMAALTNCSGPLGGCPLVSVNQRGWLNFSSSDPAVFEMASGYPSSADDYGADPSSPLPSSYPTLANRLVPVARGTATLTARYSGGGGDGSVGATATVAVSVEDTYQDAWPRASPASDTSADLSANMSGDVTVVYRVVPSAALPDLEGSPPSAEEVESGGGVALASQPGGGPHFYGATASGLSPGTNYTVLLAVRAGATLASGITALTGLLVPDTQPPSFTVARLVSEASNATLGSFSLSVDLGVSEHGSVSWAVYRDPSCVTGNLTASEVRAGANLAEAGKCSCGPAYCASAGRGRLVFAAGGEGGGAGAGGGSGGSGGGSSSSLRDRVSLGGLLPPSPYEALRGAGSSALTCGDRSWLPPHGYASRRHTLYLLAEDDLPTYRGWTSDCSSSSPLPVTSPSPSPSPLAPTADAGAGQPCAPVTVVRCNNTAPASEANNPQRPPFAEWDATASGAAVPPPPAFQPLRSVVVVADAAPVSFEKAELDSSSGVNETLGGNAATGGALLFSFALSRPALVRWTLVRNVVEVLGWGMLPVFEAGREHSVSISRDCAGEQLVEGTAYGVWYNATDAYGGATPLRMLSRTL